MRNLLQCPLNISLSLKGFHIIMLLDQIKPQTSSNLVRSLESQSVQCTGHKTGCPFNLQVSINTITANCC